MSMPRSGTIAITMAGLGSRFTKAGYTCPKYEIEVLGRPLFDWSLCGLNAFKDAGWEFTFATRREEAAIPFVTQRCATLGITMGPIIELDGVTDGQATTALYLAEQSDQDASFAVFNIDTFVAPDMLHPDQIDDALEGWVPCFDAPGDGWSFARLGADGDVAELREKVRIAPHATIGFYWFESARAYRTLYDRHFADGAGTEKGERYIAPMYNSLIQSGGRVQILDVPFEMVGMLGTPEQVATFTTSPPASALAAFPAASGTSSEAR